MRRQARLRENERNVFRIKHTQRNEETRAKRELLLR